MSTPFVIDWKQLEVIDPVNNRSEKSVSLDTKAEEIEKQTDQLYFMETFDFPDLGELKESLLGSKELIPEQVEEVISGLATLPEYSG